MLRDVLGDAGCQLVRLGLAGNALGDAGLTTMSQGLLVRKKQNARFYHMYHNSRLSNERIDAKQPFLSSFLRFSFLRFAVGEQYSDLSRPAIQPHW